MARRGLTNKQKALKMFRMWRDAGYEMQITSDLAHTITNGLVGTRGDNTKMSLAAVSVRYIAKGGEVE